MYTPTLFLCWRDRRRELPNADLAGAAKALRGVGGLKRALGFVPVAISADQPYAADGRGPALTLELRFETALALETAARAEGPLAGLCAYLASAGSLGSEPDVQAFAGRDFPTGEPTFRLGRDQRACTFLVEYPGTTADPEGWLDYYDEHHPPIMVRFPGIREVATFRPLAATIGLPCARAHSLQRNKVVFDSGEALAAALTSPVMAEMRADRDGFQPSTEKPTHFPTATIELV